MHAWKGRFRSLSLFPLQFLKYKCFCCCFFQLKNEFLNRLDQFHNANIENITKQTSRLYKLRYESRQVWECLQVCYYQLRLIFAWTYVPSQLIHFIKKKIQGIIIHILWCMLLMKESVLSCEEKTTQHWFTYLVYYFWTISVYDYRI